MDYEYVKAYNVIETPTEESFFALLGIDKVPAPEKRQPDWRKRL